jgi:glycosyltransferase involved in cell wall biosynthesis
MRKGLVTVCIPVHRKHVFLERCMVSASAQDYINIEFLILINSSIFTIQDKEEIAKIFKERDYKIVDASEKIGVSFALNKGLSQMNGEYFAWLSSDDYWEKDRISNHINILEKENQEVGLCWSGWKNVNESDTILNKISSTSSFGNPSKFYKLFTGQFNGCAITIRSSVFKNVGLFDENLYYTQDYDMWFKIISQYNICISDKILTSYQLHYAQTTRMENTENEYLELWSKLVRNIDQKILDETNKIKTEIIILIYEIFIAGQYPKILKMLKKELLKELAYESEEILKIPKKDILKILTLNELTMDESSTLIQLQRDELGVLAHGYRELYEQASDTVKNYNSRKIIRLLRKFKLF